ncbi:MAG: hypothetical protein HRU35_07990, partial [Rickettsiaceae bacterium]|nr:hypothetical protein [Rickettsiaceae bacterium]
HEANANDLGKYIRAHWQVEAFHWILDVSFKEDKIPIVVNMLLPI